LGSPGDPSIMWTSLAVLVLSGSGRRVSASNSACIGCAMRPEVGCILDSVEDGGDLERTETLLVRFSKR
jgi:hypothetical protein